jgi:zinc transport system substrate-binding protein
MDGVSEPILLVEGTASPHSYIMKPSHAEAINNADLIFFVSDDLETFLEGSLNNISNSAKIVELMDNEDLFVLKFRENNIYLGDDHEDHDDHDDHEDHKEHDDHDDHHDEDKHAKHDDHEGHDDHEDHDDHDNHDDHDDHDDHHAHAHGEYDIHIWLDPFNAKVIANNIAKELSILDPENTSKYQENRDKFVDRVNETEQKISQQLDHYLSYVTFHDAYQYFENRFDVASSGALTLNPDVLPGARQLSDVRELISDNDIHCIFSEPQFNPKVVEVIADDTDIKMGILDPLGATIPLGKDHYFGVLTDIADSLKGCGHDH